MWQETAALRVSIHPRRVLGHDPPFGDVGSIAVSRKPNIDLRSSDVAFVRKPAASNDNNVGQAGATNSVTSSTVPDGTRTFVCG